jgi:hypothetical protein
MAANMVEQLAVALGCSGGHVDRNPVTIKSIKKSCNSFVRWINCAAALHFRYQSCTLNLSLALCPSEAMPPAPAFAGGVLRVNDDRPAVR